jgi:shikimate kinase
MPKNNIFFLIGFMGSGKSYFGNKISKKLNYTFVDLDTYIETESMMFISDIFARFGEQEFRRIEAECLRKVSENQNKIIVSCGGGTPFYESNWEWMQERGHTIFLKQSIEVLFQRLKKQKNKRPLIKSLDDTQLLEFVKSKLSERETLYSKATVTLEDISVSKLLEIISNLKA